MYMYLILLCYKWHLDEQHYNIMYMYSRVGGLNSLDFSFRVQEGFVNVVSLPSELRLRSNENFYERSPLCALLGHQVLVFFSTSVSIHWHNNNKLLINQSQRCASSSPRYL